MIIDLCPLCGNKMVRGGPTKLYAKGISQVFCPNCTHVEATIISHPIRMSFMERIAFIMGIK